MARTTALFLLLLLLFVSCGKPQQSIDKSHWYLEDEIDFLDIKTFISEVKIVSLETKNYLVGYAEKIIKSDSLYYIQDNRHNKCIYLFNNEGKEAGIFKKVGEGNNEYLDIKDFDSDSKHIILLSYPSKLFFIDKKTLDIENTISLPRNRYYERMVIDNNNKILLYDHYNGVVESVDPLTGEQKIIHKVNFMKGYTFDPQPVFYKCSNKLFFQAPGNDTIYTIKDNKFDTFIVFDYKEKKLTFDFYANREPGAIELKEIALYPVINIETIFEQGDSFGFIYTFGGLKRINTIKNGIRKDNLLKYHLPFNTCNSTNNKIITSENPYRWDINQTDISDYIKGIKIEKTFYRINKADDNPILFEYSIKQ